MNLDSYLLNMKKVLYMHKATSNYCKPTFVHENFVLRFTEDKLVSND